MISLHIKGDMRDAFTAADAHQVELNSIAVRYRSGIAETFASCYDRDLTKVMQWYGEDTELIDGYGYEKGTLLLFSVADKEV